MTPSRKRIGHTHLEAIGEVRERNPWIEDTWRVGSFCLVHWQQLRHPVYSSAIEPKHTWRLHIPRTTLRLVVQYGVAPR